MIEIIAWVALSIGLLCALIIIADLFGHPQQMAIMNVVWPLNAWFFGPITLWAYFKLGRVHKGEQHHTKQQSPAAQVFVSTTHCAAGCSFGDAIGGPLVMASGLAIAGSVLFTHYIVEFILAFLFGILFQFAAIYPMHKDKGIGHALKSALKADAIALIAFEVGMFAWMAVSHFLLFATLPEPTSPVYWFMMQIAMILGFFTSYPANWWLMKKGVKHEM